MVYNTYFYKSILYSLSKEEKRGRLDAGSD